MNGDYLSLINNILVNESEGIDLYNQLRLILIETIIVFTVGFILHKVKNVSYKKIFHVYLTVVYLGIILSFTIFRREPGSRGGIHFDINLGFGLKGNSFSKWSSTFSILNILLFVPWGILISSFTKNKKLVISLLITVFVGLITSAYIEITQLLTGTGVFEVTDILTNTFGTLLGAVIFFVIHHILILKKQKRQIV